MRLTFYGGAQTVTGANYLLESEGTKILVDCGLLQTGFFCDRNNFDPFPYDPKTLAAAFVTHAHIDHTGKLPKLMKEGFSGTVYSTPPTRDFAKLLLLDSESLMNREAQREQCANLYSAEDIQSLMAHWKNIDYHQQITVGPFTVTLYDAGHILGSSIVVVEAEGKKLAFSGDLGNSPAPIIRPTETLGNLSIATCLVESAYGNRLHEDLAERKDKLEDVIEETVKTGGVLIIPAFAMERTQLLLYELDELIEYRRIPRVPVFIDSPLAIQLTEVYQTYRQYFNDEVKSLIRSGDEIFKFPGLHMTMTTEESKAINDVPPPKIILAGSGMSHGGRILHHERRYLPDPKNTLLIIGYQAEGSPGRKILEGVRSIRIFGEEVPVRCRVEAIGGYSAHADQTQLLQWLRSMQSTLQKVYVVQGEADAANILRQKIIDELTVDAYVPARGESVVL